MFAIGFVTHQQIALESDTIENMTGSMALNGFTAHIEYSAEDDCLIGHIEGIRDIVGFHAKNPDDLREAFHEAVEDYLDVCRPLGKR